MKKLVASVGLVALSAASLHAAAYSSLTADSPKPWSIALTLRGFYDDNVNGTPNEKDSFGFEVNPSAGWMFSFERTAITLGYDYSLKWYEEPRDGAEDDFDQTHNFHLALDHAFSPRYQLSVRNDFVIGQEPDLLRADETITGFQPISGDNIRNHGTIDLIAQLTPTFGLGVGYANAYFNYDDEWNENDPFDQFPSFSGLLDRVEHSGHIDGRFQLQPATVGLLGYKYRENLYIGDELIFDDGFTQYESDVRNSRFHYVYLGAEHNFRPDLYAIIHGGVSFIDYYNDPNDETDVAPYVRANVRYTYLPESFFEGGFSYDRSATDLFDPDQNGNISVDAQTATVWASVTHRITPKLYASLTGQLQNSAYNGGDLDDSKEWFYILGANVEYRFNQHFSAHVGYNYDELDSDVDSPDAIASRDFNRNRVYIGVTAAY